MDEIFPSCKEITEQSLQKFSALLKPGEETREKWNVLSTIVEYNKSSKECKVVALGTGTKCIGVDKMCRAGSILNDSHAEVMCRRSFLRYLYYQLLNKSDIIHFDEDERCFCLDPNITYHFFSTHPPCGDATIDQSDENENSPVQSKRTKLDCDYVCTGAKLLGVIKGIDSETGVKSDPLNQDEGALRTKPGRGVRTLSMSCSDKLSKWNVLGIQGALLDSLLDEPIYLETLNFCCDSQREPIERAVYNRWKSKAFESPRFVVQTPKIRINREVAFELAKLDEKTPSSRSMSWCDIPETEKPLEIAVNGKKEGITKKALKKSTSCGALQISKMMLSQMYLRVLNKHPLLGEGVTDQNSNEICYLDLKNSSKSYQKSWNTLKRDYFGNWTSKPADLLAFNVKL